MSKRESKLKKLRVEQGLSLRDLGQKTGYSYEYIRQIELGNYDNPSVDFITKLASALDIDLWEAVELFKS